MAKIKFDNLRLLTPLPLANITDSIITVPTFSNLTFGSSWSMRLSFLKRCPLTNKAVGTIWRAWSKPPQRRQGPDPRPLWLLVRTPSAFGPELAYRLHVAQSTLMDVTRYFDILLYYYTCLCTTFLWPLHFGWLLVLSLHKEDYLQFFKCVSFWLHGFCG